MQAADSTGTPVNLRDRLKHMRRGSAALDAILTAPGALARSLDIAATQELAATPNSNVEFQAGAFSTHLSSTPLRHEEVAVALENESGATSGRRASSSLAVPPFSGMKFSDGFAHTPEARLAAPQSVRDPTRRSSVSALSFNSPSAVSSVQPRRSSVALGIGWTGRSSSLNLGSHNITAFDGSAEPQDHVRIEQLEKRLVDTMQREASLNVYLSDVISRQDHESAMAEAATAHALKMGEAAVNAEREQQALAKELAVTLSAHSSEMERARKTHLSETELLKDQVAILKESSVCLRKDLEETALQRDVLAGDNERQADLLQDLQFQIKDLVEVEAQASVENAAIQKQSSHALQRMRSNFDEESRVRQSLNDQLVSSVAANSSLSRQLDDLRQSLKASQDKEILLQADLDKSCEVHAVFQANIAASAIKISELESELSSLRSTVAEKLPLADRVLQLEKDANVSMVLLQETKTAHEEALSQISSLVADKAALLQRLELVQTQAEERYNRTFKSKAEYISQVEAADSALEQTRQQLLQLQLTNNDMRSRLEEAKQSESQYTVAVRETARKQILEELGQQMKSSIAIAVSSFDSFCSGCLQTVDHKLHSFGKRIATCQINVAKGAKTLSYARALAASTQSNHDKAMAALSCKLNDALLTITAFPGQLRIEQEQTSLLRAQIVALELELSNSKSERSLSNKIRVRLLWKKFCAFLCQRHYATQQIIFINQLMQPVHQAMGGVHSGHPLTVASSQFDIYAALAGSFEIRQSIGSDPFHLSSDLSFVASSRNYIVLQTAAHASAISRHMVAAFSGSSCASSSNLFSSIASPGDSRGNALATASINASRLPELSAALDDALAREREADVKYAATRVQLEEAHRHSAELEQALNAETVRYEKIRSELDVVSLHLQESLARANEADALVAAQGDELSSVKSSNTTLCFALDELQLKCDEQVKAAEHFQKLILQYGEDTRRHRDLMVLGAQALTASKIDRLELGCKLQENQSDIARLEAILENERQKVVLLQVSQSQQKAKRNTLLGSVQDLTSRVSELMGKLQDQHTLFERKLREERRSKSSLEIKFLEESSVLQGNLNEAMQEIITLKTEADHASERLAIAHVFIERAHKVRNAIVPSVDVAVQTAVSSLVMNVENPFFDLSCITTLPKTPQSPNRGDILQLMDNAAATVHQRASVSPSIRDGSNGSADLQDVLQALSKAEQAASTYRKELIDVTSQSAKDAHQFRLDIMNALVLAMDLTEIRSILKGSYAISTIASKGLTGPTGVSEERARRGQALLDEIETGVVTKSHELVEWASEYEAELETKVAILIARKRLREKLNTIVGQMGALRSTQIAGQRNDLLKALKRIEREVQAVTTGDMTIVSSLSGSDFTQRDNSWVRTDRAFLLCNKIWMSRTLDAVDSLISRVAASSTMPFASGKSSKFTSAGHSR